MDKTEIFTENNEYKIVFSRKKKLYSLTPFSQYNITIDFINALGLSVYSITTTEKEFLSALESINQFNINIGSVYGDNIWFSNGTFNDNFLYIAMKYPDISYPSEEEETILYSFYQSSIHGNVLRLYFESSNGYWLEEFIYNMYLILEDLPYLNDMISSNILEFMEYEALGRPI